MPDIVLRDRSGNPLNFSGADYLDVLTSNGETASYIHTGLVPEMVENLPIALDFSNGNQVVTAPDGVAVKSAIIQKPEDLISENIAEGVIIAGIAGALAAKGGKEVIELITRTITSITIPDGITSIGNFAFAGCTNLTSITIPDSVTSIGASAFQNSGLISVTVPPNVSVGAYAFSCPSLSSAVIESGVSLANNAFRNSSKLANVTVKDGVTSISAACFSACTALKSIVIPASVKFIGMNAFLSTGLASATFNDASGWYISTSSTATSGSGVVVSNASTAANYLKSTYVSYYWFNNS